jgi:hypothetical protein
MARKRTLKQFSEKDLLEEIARRHADKHFREGMTMSEMELSVEELKAGAGEPSIALMLSRMKPEKPSGKACPKCGKRIPVKARDRERTVQSLSGAVTFKRNYHYCGACKYGFYPVDRLLGLPEEGELTSELEKRVLDFAVNDVYGECAARWSLHYQQPVSGNLFRRVAARVGEQCEVADQGRLQEELKPRSEAAEVLVVEVDGSMLPIRGQEPRATGRSPISSAPTRCRSSTGTTPSSTQWTAARSSSARTAHGCSCGKGARKRSSATAIPTLSSRS